MGGETPISLHGLLRFLCQKTILKNENATHWILNNNVLNLLIFIAHCGQIHFSNRPYYGATRRLTDPIKPMIYCNSEGEATNTGQTTL